MINKDLGAAILAAVGVTFAGGGALAGKADDTLTVAFPRQLETLDAYGATAREAIILARHIWDSLLYRDQQSGEYVGNLATGYEWVDSLTIDFTLRENVTFHNGEPFDADDVVHTLNWASNPESGVQSQGNVNWIENVEKTGPYSVRLHLKRPFPAALEYLSGPLVIYPNEYFEKVGARGMGTDPVGTGPYRLEEIRDGTTYVLKANENYHGGPKGNPSIGTVVWRTIPDQSTQFAELLSGGVDWIWQVPPEQSKALTGRFQVVDAQTMRIGFLNLDAAGRSGENPLVDKRVRQALNHAINRQGIVDALVQGAAQVVHTACFPTQFGCDQDVTVYDYDPERARELLAEAGYPDGLTLPFYAYRDRVFAEAIIGDLRAVGIEVDFSFLNYAALRDRSQAGEVPMQLLAWGSYSVNDVSAVTSHYFRQGSDDYARDTTVAGLLESGDSSIDPDRRRSDYSKALKIIADEAYWVPLWSYSTNYVFTEELNFTPNEDEVTRFYAASWK